MNRTFGRVAIVCIDRQLPRTCPAYATRAYPKCARKGGARGRKTVSRAPQKTMGRRRMPAAQQMAAAPPRPQATVLLPVPMVELGRQEAKKAAALGFLAAA